MITHNKNSTVGSKEDSLADLQKHDRNLEQVKESLEKFVGYIKEANAEVCDTIPEIICVPVVMGVGGCINFVLRSACSGNNLIFIFQHVLELYFIWIFF